MHRSVRLSGSCCCESTGARPVILVVIPLEQLMASCVYTTQYPIWLDAAITCDADAKICFHSNKKWATAKKLLERSAPLPLLIRRQEDETEEFACRYIADLQEITFREDIDTDSERLAWLDEKLWFQRQTIQGLPRTPQFATWEEQYKAWEIDHFMKSTTWYTIANLREISPLPLPRLRKLDGDHPLAPNYIRGYALCHYPDAEIKVIRSANAG